MKHTQEKWDIHGDFSEIHPITDEDGLDVLADVDPDGTHTAEERKRIAMLIAKAPEMLEALKQAQQWLARGLAEGINEGTALPNALERLTENIRNIIHQAEGE